MKFGFILDSSYLPPDLSALYEASKTDSNIEISLLIIYGDERVEVKGVFRRALTTFRKLGFLKTIARVLLKLVFIYEAKGSTVTPSPESDRYLAVADLGIPVLRANPIISKSGYKVEFSYKDLDSIKSEGIDVLVRGCDHLLVGEILEICKYGILGLHHGDDHRFRGSPSGFWEVYTGSPVTHFIIQRLCPMLDRGDQYYRGEILTRATAWENSYILHEVARSKFIPFMKQLAATHKLPEQLKLSEEILPPKKLPTVTQLLKYIFCKTSDDE